MLTAVLVMLSEYIWCVYFHGWHSVFSVVCDAVSMMTIASLVASIVVWHRRESLVLLTAVAN